MTNGDQCAFPPAAARQAAVLRGQVSVLGVARRPSGDRLDLVPGVDRRVAEVLLAEVGPDMKPFPTHANLAAWAGMCPGNDRPSSCAGESILNDLARIFMLRGCREAT